MHQTYRDVATYLAPKAVALEKNQEFLVAFGKRVRDLRLERGMSMRAVADALNIDKNQLSRIEDAKINTSVLMAYSLAKVFKVTLPELLTIDLEDE